jgi:MFS family permease
MGVATLTGVLMAGRTLLSMVAAPMAGTMSDWLGSRWRVAAWGLSIGVISMVLVAWGEPLAILAGVSLSAVAGGSVPVLATALTGDLVSQAQRGRAIGLLHTAGDLGSAIGPPAAYALMMWIGLQGVYLLCAGLFAAGLALAMLLRPRITW